LAASPLGFIAELAGQLTPTLVGDSTGQAVVRHEVLRGQCLYDDDRGRVGERPGETVQIIGPLASHFGVKAADPGLSAAPPAGLLFAATSLPVAPGGLPLGAGEAALGVTAALAGAELGHDIRLGGRGDGGDLDPPVDSDHQCTVVRMAERVGHISFDLYGEPPGPVCVT
jgi:hypothetical protein